MDIEQYITGKLSKQNIAALALVLLVASVSIWAISDNYSKQDVVQNGCQVGMALRVFNSDREIGEFSKEVYSYGGMESTSWKAVLIALAVAAIVVMSDEKNTVVSAYIAAFLVVILFAMSSIASIEDRQAPYAEICGKLLDNATMESVQAENGLRLDWLYLNISEGGFRLEKKID